MSLSAGDKIGSWQSRFGKAEITVKSEIGQGYASQLDAQKAIQQQKTQAAIVETDDGRFRAYKIDDGAYMDDLNLGESVEINDAGKAAGVVDFVGADGYALEDASTVAAPIGKDNGKTVYFLSAFPGKWDKALMGDPGRWLAADELLRVRTLGYSVVVDQQATSDDLFGAFYDPKSAGVIYDGHGSGGGVWTQDDDLVHAREIETHKVSKNLKFFYTYACHAAQNAPDWQKALGGSRFYGWSRVSTLPDAVLVNAPSLSPVGSAYYTATRRTLDQVIGDNL